LGVFNRKITPKAGEWGLIIGFIIGMIRLGLMVFDPGRMHDLATNVFIFDETKRHGLFTILNINWLHFCFFLFIFTMALMFVISMFTQKATEEQLKGITYFSQTPEQKAETRNSWNKWDVILTAGVVVVVILFYIYFW
jgi:SSS family solute:Na+ symporter